MQCVALGSKATFSYLPSSDEMKKYLALQRGKTPSSYKDYHMSPEEKNEAM